MSSLSRRLDGWGYDGEAYPIPPALEAWLVERLGSSSPLPRLDASRFAPPPAAALPDLAGTVSRDGIDRLLHARGRALLDLVRLRTGTVAALPDAVARPADEAELETVLRRCSADGIRVIPWGGGTSVTGGVNLPPDGRPTLSLDLERLAGLYDLDETSGLATFGAGTLGPEVEAPLAERDLTLGHFPQSWELSTLGGWVVTRSSGQESLAYGGIESLVAGVALVSPSGRWSLPPLPASAAGPDLRQLVLGSEGRLGIVTRVTVRVSPRPGALALRAALLPDWETGVAVVRRLVRDRVPLSLLRLSDEAETASALRVGLAGHARAGAVLERVQRLRGVAPPGCLLLYGAAGGRALGTARAVLRRHRWLPLGSTPGRRWIDDRFRHPYLRDTLLDRGIAVETFETAAPWSVLPRLYAAVRRTAAAALEPLDERTVVLCHLSHPYPDGASLYFTVFFRCPGDADEAAARWARLKRAILETLVAHRAAISHHHGVGAWHAPWLGREIGEPGLEILRRVATAADPAGILNPQVLLDPSDRLEV